MSTQKKINIVEDLTEKLSKAKSLVLADYQGLTHQQLEDLRKNLEEAEADFVVIKNTLLKKALGKTDLAEKLSDETFQGPNALLLAYGDELLPLKKITQFVKQFQLPNLRAGIFSGKALNKSELITLSTLPSKDVLLGQLVGQLKSPLIRLTFALNSNLQRLVLVLRTIEKTKKSN
ncbi:50S ribosomal protein L10 [Candidatus Microgenomates bacterium]|nr:50S ribosomal protein L10 [Candidatus Microgenomates bacterium]